MPKRKHKKYNRPRKIYDLATIKEEQGLLKKYGLKNRKEVWKANYSIGRIRRIAKSLITADDNEKEEFVKRQKNKGFAVENLADVLALNKEDYLKRRLQSIIVKKKLASTHKQARQFIVHKHVSVEGNILNSPAHLTTLKEEANIELNLKVPTKKLITEEEREILEKIKPKKEESGE